LEEWIEVNRELCLALVIWHWFGLSTRKTVDLGHMEQCAGAFFMFDGYLKGMSLLGLFYAPSD
jgi:alpha-L-fucosidase